jgi:hypothetical protein
MVYTYTDRTEYPSIITTTAGHGHELENLAKVYEDEAKYDREVDPSNHGKADIVNSEGEGRGNEDTTLDKLDLHDDFKTPSLDTDNDPDHDSDQMTTIFTAIDDHDMLENFADQSTHHIVTKDFNIHRATPLMGVITINIPIRRIIFDVVALFLLCLRYMERLGIYLDNYPMHGKSPSRFLHDDADFYCFIYADMMYIQILIVIHYCMLPMKILATGCEFHDIARITGNADCAAECPGTFNQEGRIRREKEESESCYSTVIQTLSYTYLNKNLNEQI